METKPLPLETVRLRLLLPGAPVALSPRNTDRILLRLGIEPTLEKVEGFGQAIKHVTPKQAAEIEAEFRLTHRNKFRAAEQKASA